MELSHGWRAIDADDALRRTYYQHSYDDLDWEPVTVPGHWRSHAAFAGSDGPILHRCRFTHPRLGPGRRAWLVFDGIFYQADHWLDGNYLGDTEGYFMPHSFEVTQALRARSEHVLALEVICAPQTDRSAKRNITGVFQHWDCLDPDWNPGGIWRPVHIVETGPVRIQHLQVLCREATSERAVVAFRAVLDSDAARTVRLHTTVGAQDIAAHHPLAAGSNTLDWTIIVERPELWWPHALGPATLHDTRVAVHLDAGDNPDAGSHSSDERRLQIGLRSVQLRNWICSINGERMFLKGTNQGPARMDLGHATADEVRRDVELAVGTGLDLMRVHGHISRPELYQAADEAGLLLWQDFPLQWGYARGIRREAARQARTAVQTLAHHPSIVLWCAHNEPMAIDTTEPSTSRLGRLRLATTTARAQQLPTWNKTVLDGSIKRAFERSDGTRPVIPHSGIVPHLPRLDGTASHLYFGWYWGDERSFARFCRTIPRMARFVSEFGTQAVPSGDGAAFMKPERWPDLDWEHLVHTHGLQRSIFERYVPPGNYSSFDAWCDATQRYQATVIKHHIETLRRLKYRPAGGFAQFCFADAHPAVSWSVLDHERRPKLGYDALRAACQPVVAVADRMPARVAPGDDLVLDIHVVSDRRDPIEGATVTATLLWHAGRHIQCWTGDVPADSCVRVGTVQVTLPASLTPDPSGSPLTLRLDLRLPDNTRLPNHYESCIAGQTTAG
jgi:beta-mannosidase